MSFPSEQMIVNSAFNGWIAHKRLAVVHEIYSGQSRKGYDRVKSTIADNYVTVNRKHIEQYSLKNYLHVLACSNSLRAIHLDDEDRRWFVPQVTEETKDKSWWNGLYAWLAEGGLGIIRRWADEFLRDNDPVATGDHAPKSIVKSEIIAELRSDGSKLAHDLAKAILDPEGLFKDKNVVVAIQEVREWVARKRGLDIDDHRRLESQLTLRKAMRAAGLMEPSRREDGRPRFKITIGDDRNSRTMLSHVMANFLIDKDAKWPEIKEHFKTADDIWPM